MRTNILLIVLVVSQHIAAQTTWYPIPSGTQSHLRSIDFPSENVGYVVGDSCVMLKTVDGGATWNPVNYSGIGPLTGVETFSDIDFVDELNGILVVSNIANGSYSSSDGGLSWTADMTTSNMCYKQCAFPISADNWFLGGAGCFQSAMIDHRTSAGWTYGILNYESFNPTEYVVQMDFVGSIGLAAMNGKYMLRSADSGATWDTIPTGIAGVHTSVHFVDGQTAYAGYNDNGSGFGILVSSDAGLTWTQDVNSATFLYPAFLSVTSAENGDVYSGAYASGGFGGGLIFEMIGTAWSFESVAQAINDMESYGNDVTFGVGDSGLIVVNQEISILGLDDHLYDDKNELFPNPTKDFVSLAIDAGTTSNFLVVNLNGEKQDVRTEQTPAAVIFDLSELPNGVYFLKVESEQSIHSHRIVKMD